jgi:uncharacterized heparinase superfamily protein
MQMHPLISPYSGWDADRVLAYFQARADVSYFPVIADPIEVTREKMDAIVEGRFEFNGETHVIPEKFNWRDNPSADVEWLISLHKFYYAAGLGSAYQETGDPRYASKWMQLTDSWIESARVEFLSSDVTGRRIQNWTFAHYYFVTGGASLSATFHARFIASLHAQVDWLRNHLTPARNHRTLELVSIFMAAVVFPEMRDSAEWLAFAIAALLDNMRSDLLADGVQCELSTDYHHVVLRNYLVARRLAKLNRITLPSEMDAFIRRALEFAKWAHRPDGLIPSLSDGDTGSFLDLLEQGYELYGDPEMLYVATRGRDGQAPPERARAFEASGYYVLRSGWDEGIDERYLIFDCGPLGAGNHGHLDLLHFEAYAYGRPLIVDPGRYTYYEGEPQNWRVLFRGTSYHNTVTVDGRDQIRYEFDKTRFRIRGPEPERELRSFVIGDEIDYLQATCRSHEYDAFHERRIIFVRGEYWIVSDLLSAPEPHDYDLRFHLSPEAQYRVTTQGNSALAPFIVIAQPSATRTTLSIEPGFVSPKYGVKHSAPIIRFSQRARNAVFHTVLVPHRGVQPQVEVESSGDRQLRITIQFGDAVLVDSIEFDEIGKPSFERQAESAQELLAAR